MNEYEILNEALEKLKDKGVSIDELKSAVEMKKHATELNSMWVSRTLAVASIVISGVLLAYQIYVLAKNNEDGLLDRYHKTLIIEIDQLEETRSKLLTTKRDLEQEEKELLSRIDQLTEVAKANAKAREVQDELTNRLISLNNQIDAKTAQLENANDLQALNSSLSRAQQELNILQNEYRAEVRNKTVANLMASQLQQKLLNLEAVDDFISETIYDVNYGDSTTITTKDGQRFEFSISAIDTKKGNFDMTVIIDGKNKTTVTNLYGDRYFFAFNEIAFLIYPEDIKDIKTGTIGSISIGVFPDGKAKLIF